MTTDVAFGRAELLAYMRAARLGVISSLGPDGTPQSALVGFAVTDDHQIVFDTVSSSRKHRNLESDPRAAFVIGGPAEKTLQLEGFAALLPIHGADGEATREAYYRAWPDGRDRLDWPGLAYWRIDPSWARYTDYDAGPLIAEFRWPE